MKYCMRTARAVALAFFASGAIGAASAQTPESLITPDSVETRIGTLDFKDGTPLGNTASAVYDNLDFTYAFRAFTDTFKGVSVEAARQGFEAAGIKDNEILIFSKLMGFELALPDRERRYRVLPELH